MSERGILPPEAALFAMGIIVGIGMVVLLQIGERNRRSNEAFDRMVRDTLRDFTSQHEAFMEREEATRPRSDPDE